MFIIIENASCENRLDNGIDTILGLDESLFESLLKELEKKCVFLYFFYKKETENVRGHLRPPKEIYSINEILEALKKRLNDFNPNSQEYTRISKILNSRRIDGFIEMCSKENKISQSIVSAVFEILGDEEKFNKFINYEDNVKEFSIDGVEIAKSEYLKCMASIFGEKKNNYNPFSHYDIPEHDVWIQRYRELYDRVNLERYANLGYEFRQKGWGKNIRKGDEPNWTVNLKVQQEAYSNMPPDLSPEEKTIWIYLKLCQMFPYDEGYQYRDLIMDSREEIFSLNDIGKIRIAEEGETEHINYTDKFSRQHLEAIVPGSKITCYDFARIYSNMVNDFKDDIDGVTLEELLSKHFFNGIYSDKVSATLDSTSNQVSEDGMNDLLRVKLGINIEGIKTIYDPDNILRQAIERLYPLIIGREPITIEAYRAQLKDQINESRGKRKRTNYNYRFD